MKELFIFAGYLGALLMILWVIVFLTERLLKKKVKGKVIRSEEGDDTAVVPVIVAAVEVYEQSFGKEGKKDALKRVVYIRKEDTISFWKLRGRVK